MGTTRWAQMDVLVLSRENVARSPLAAAVLAREVPGVEVGSAGILAHGGQPVVDGARRLATERGLDLSSHRSRRLTPAMLRRADLILTMSGRERDAVAPLAPGLACRAYTIIEFHRLTSTVDVADAPTGHDATRLLWLRERAALSRPSAPPPQGPEDIEDPQGGPPQGWEELGDVLDRHLAALGGRVCT